jgi:hypothetical protein
MKRIPVIVFILVCSVGQCFPQSMNSLKGLYTIPTAEIPKDREVTLGSFFLKREYLDPKLSDFDKDALVYFGSIAFLPFFETSIRFTRPMEPHGGAYAIGDRMFAFKVQFFREGEHTPSLSFGAQDFIHSRAAVTNLFNSTYIVATKNVQWGSDVNVKATAGYGFKVVTARAYQFIGLFAGVSAELFHTFEVIGEYDALNLNGAVRLDVFNHIRLLGGIVKGKYFSGGASCYFEL